MNKFESCFARRHMSPVQYAIYLYALDVTSGGRNIFYRSDREIAKEFGKRGIHKDTVMRAIHFLEKEGWLVRRTPKHQRRNRKTGRVYQIPNPKTGKIDHTEYDVLNHSQWIEIHPSECRFIIPDPETGSGEPVLKMRTGEKESPVLNLQLLCPKNQDEVLSLVLGVHGASPMGDGVEGSTTLQDNPATASVAPAKGNPCTQGNTCVAVDVQPAAGEAPQGGSARAEPSHGGGPVQPSQSEHGEDEAEVWFQDERIAGYIKKSEAIQRHKEMSRTKKLAKRMASDWEVYKIKQEEDEKEFPVFPGLTNQDLRKLSAFLKHGEDQLLWCWQNYMERSRGFEGLSEIVSVFFTELPIRLAGAKTRVAMGASLETERMAELEENSLEDDDK